METRKEIARYQGTEADQRNLNWAAAVARAPRLEIADNLRRHFALTSDINPEAAWIGVETHPAASTASIGIEVELWWSHILPAELADILTSGRWNGLNEQEKQAFNNIAEPIGYPHQERCEETVKLGVPSRGNDGLWEFSHQPAWHYRTLIEEVRQLVVAGLIPEERLIPLHVTLGGVTADTNVQLLLRTMEIAGGSNIQRLSVSEPTSGWARRGTAGVAARSKWKLELGQEVGVELRTLLFQDIGQLDRLLGWAQNGGSLIKAIQVNDDPQAKASWQSFVHNVELITGMSTESVRWIDPVLNRRQWEMHLETLGDPGITKGMKQLLDNFVL